MGGVGLLSTFAPFFVNDCHRFWWTLKGYGTSGLGSLSIFEYLYCTTSVPYGTQEARKLTSPHKRIGLSSCRELETEIIPINDTMLQINSLDTVNVVVLEERQSDMQGFICPPRLHRGCLELLNYRTILTTVRFWSLTAYVAVRRITTMESIWVYSNNRMAFTSLLSTAGVSAHFMWTTF